MGEAVASSSGAAVTAELRRLLLESLVRRGPVELVGERTGSLTLGATRGLRALEPYFGRYLPAAVVAAIAPLAALAVLAILDWPSALVALGLAALVPVAMIRLGRRAAAESDRQWRRLSSMSARFLELLRGIPTLRALGRVDRARREVVAANEAVASSLTATLRAAMTSSAALEFLAGVGVGLVAMLAGLRLLHGGFGVAPALAVILVTPEVFLPLRRAGAEFHASTEGRAAAETVFAAIDAGTDASGPGAGGRGGGHVTPIDARDLAASYDQAVLTGVSFTLGQGQHLVVDGPSGAGKTTLLALLCGFVAPAGGDLRLGGTSVTELDWPTARESISLLPQSPHVFSRSLRDNLTLGTPGFDEAALRGALEMVGLGHLVDATTLGLDRPLAEGGTSLSAGENQRLGLARAVLQDRPLVLLDEPTSHLDEATIADLRHRLAGWLGERTVIEVTHRPGLLAATAPRLTLGLLGASR